jgi:hypothetical protein
LIELNRQEEFGYFIFPKRDALNFRLKLAREKDIYVQYLQADFNKDEMLRIKRINDDWRDNVQILIVVENKQMIPAISDLQNIRIIEKEKMKFNSQYMSSNILGHYLISPQKRLIYRGYDNDDYDAGMKAVFEMRYHKVKFAVSDFIGESKIYEKPWMRDWERYFPRPSLVLGAFFTSVCNTCTSGKLVKLLDNIQNKFGNAIEIRAMLSDDFSPQDIVALKTQLDLHFAFDIAGSRLALKWNELIKQYGKDNVSDIVVLLDGKGSILRAFDRECGCFSFLEDSIAKQLSQSLGR